MSEEIKGRVLVALQLVLIVILVKTTHWPNFNAIALAFYCSSFSVAIRALIVMPPGTFNIRPTLKPASKLVTAGPYRYIRHPMYVGVLLACGGLIATNYDLLRISLFVSLFVVLFSKAAMEEKILLDSFPQYTSHKKKTGMFIPWI